MKFWMLGLVACACTGCTMMSLDRHTVAQSNSTIDLRYREVMDNLALIANDRSSLPSYSSIFAGTVSVQDSGTLNSTTTWPFSAGMEAVNPSFNRQISQNWTLDPIMVPEKLEAMRATCQWVIGGPGRVSKESMSLLIRPEQAQPGPDRHFGVADKLAQMPAGWLGVGRLKDVPLCARYKAHSGLTWVWVTPDGMKGLADFTLIIQQIARVYSNHPTLFNFPPVYSPIVFAVPDTDGADKRIRITAQVFADQSGHLVTESPYWKMRLDTLGADANLRSAISASGITGLPQEKWSRG